MLRPDPRERHLDEAVRRALTVADVEFAGMAVLVAVMERLSEDERARALAYLGNRYGAPAAR